MKIRINKYTDNGAWYKDLVGKVITVVRFEARMHDHQGIPEDVYWCREGGIYNCLNYVRYSDASLVSIEEELPECVQSSLIFSARYAHSRSSGAALQVINSIKLLWSRLSVPIRDQIITESEEAASNISDWNELRNFALKHGFKNEQKRGPSLEDLRLSEEAAARELEIKRSEYYGIGSVLLDQGFPPKRNPSRDEINHMMDLHRAYSRASSEYETAKFNAFILGQHEARRDE